MRRNRIAVILAVLSLTAALAASVLLLFMPLYEGVSVDPVTKQQTGMSATLIAVNGYRAIISLAIPPLLAAVGLLRVARAVRLRKLVVWIPALLLGIYTFITGFSIGMFYLPSAALLLAAAVSVQVQE